MPRTHAPVPNPREAAGYDPSRHAALRREVEALDVAAWPGCDLARLERAIERARRLRDQNRAHRAWLDQVMQDGRP